MNTETKDDIMYRTVGKNIRKYRELKGLSVTELSKYADLKNDFLERFEEGKKNIVISIYDLYKVSVILEISIDKFFVE